MSKAAGAALILALAACATVPAQGAEQIRERGAGKRCDASKAQVVIGKMKSKALGAKAVRLSGAGALRWIGPDTMVTMDYREDRLNLHTDARGKVVKVACG